MFSCIRRFKNRRGGDQETDFNQFVTDAPEGDGNPYGFDQFIVNEGSTGAKKAAKKRFDDGDDLSEPKAALSIFFGLLMSTYFFNLSRNRVRVLEGNLGEACCNVVCDRTIPTIGA
jgi:hypothetical protein